MHIHILKALIVHVPQLIYVCTMLHVPDWFIVRVDKLFNEFLWDGKRAKVKNSTIIGGISQGGLKMPHVKRTVESLKLNWLKRLLDPKTEGKWKKLSWGLIKASPEELSLKLTPTFLPPCSTLFYQQILDIWYNVYNVEPKDVGEILKERIWRNSRILIGGVLVQYGYRAWENSGIKRIQDLVNVQNGRILTPQEIQDKYLIVVEIMKYNCIVSAIPKQWKKRLKEGRAPLEAEAEEVEGLKKK
jgi:hypothetical protein